MKIKIACEQKYTICGFCLYYLAHIEVERISNATVLLVDEQQQKESNNAHHHYNHRLQRYYWQINRKAKRQKRLQKAKKTAKSKHHNIK